MKLGRNLGTPESREFWAFVDRTSARVDYPEVFTFLTNLRAVMALWLHSELTYWEGYNAGYGDGFDAEQPEGRNR